MFSVRSEKKESVNSREKIVLEADNKFAFKINKLFLVLISCLIVFLFLIAGELTLRFIHRVKNVDRLYFSTFSKSSKSSNKSSSIFLLSFFSFGGRWSSVILIF